MSVYTVTQYAFGVYMLYSQYGAFSALVSVVACEMRANVHFEHY